MNNNNTVKRLVKTAIIAALYAVITLVLAPISYGPIQFRVSEIMVLLAFFDPFYIVGLTLGCFIANILGPNGLADIIFGTLATFISVYAVSITERFVKSKKTSLVIASLWPTIFNGVIIGCMLNYIYQFPLVLSIGEVAIGEFVVVTIVGVPIVRLLQNKYRSFPLFCKN
ncbi:QueT transporter family protein [Clostridium beijerinckii]|uniref:Queuosine transporter QueT n=1 Tax=Clostridium beijerinckii TaxID=1520 RepID=A0A1S9N6B2_CLOBE|nr:QueT transporter family protein [Clostridium beijerinckii]MZK52882.1 QueT transporter family protein [Clostridium beijerinckii]MZK60983.1 QueT transporter family protein [Clostridium beijerinckii]MZK71189.1 QueT transporter family protein [Clostridium beijerinckii]MZK76547.1 QueT transporter family protein [Clostridium beijerinckii]MZK86206.1 QueT transporter family protein [Clostridium beijerinckii]